MPCPKYKNKCGTRDTLTSDAFLGRLDDKQYIVINKAMGILYGKLCDSEDGFRKCEQYLSGLLSGASRPGEDDTSESERGEQ